MLDFGRTCADACCSKECDDGDDDDNDDDGFASFYSAYADLCFCAKCEPMRVLVWAGAKYALPIDWFGFGIKI